MVQLKRTDLRIPRATPLVAVLLAASAPAFAAGNSPTSGTSEARPATAQVAESGAAQKAKPAEKMVCQRMGPLTGSLTPKKVCRKVTEPEKAER